MKTVGDALEEGFTWLVVHGDGAGAEMHRLDAYPEETDLVDVGELTGNTQAAPINGLSVTRELICEDGPVAAEERWLWGKP
jgi:hypothetical protein